MRDLDDFFSQETYDRKKKSLKNESTVEYNNRLDRMRLQANERRAKESDDQRSQRLEDSRNRVTLCRIQESAKQRRKRLEDSQSACKVTFTALKNWRNKKISISETCVNKHQKIVQKKHLNKENAVSKRIVADVQGD